MGMSPCYSLVRGLLIVLSILLFVVGMCMCGVCVWGVYYGGVSSPRGAAGLWWVGGAGGAALLAALLAAGGAVRSGRAALASGAAISALLAAAAAAATVWAAHHTHLLRASLSDHMRDHLTHHYSVMDLHTQLLDTIQEDLQCCGVEGPRDWSASLYSARQAAAASGADAEVENRAENQAEDGAEAGAEAGAVAAHSAPLDLSVGAPSSFYYVPPSCCNKATELDCSSPLLIPISSPPPTIHSSGCGGAVWDRLTDAWGAAVYPAGALLALVILHALLAAALAVSTRPHNRYKA